MVEQGRQDLGGGRRAAGAGVDQVAGEPRASGPPGGDPQDLGADVGRRGAVPGLAGRGLDEAADEPGQGDGVLDPEGDVGGPDLDGRPVLRQAGVEIDHAGVQDGPGRQDRVDEPVVVGGVGEDVVGAGRRPAVPGLGPVAGVAGVGALPERRVGGEGGQDRQPDPDPVEDGDALLVVLDAHVDVAAAGEHLLGGEGEGVEHPLVPLPLRRDRLDGDRRGGQGGDARADGGGRRVGPPAPEPQLRVDLGQGPADRRAELDLLRLELGHQVRGGVLASSALSCSLGGLPLAAAGGHLEGLGAQRDRPTGGVDHQQFLFDAHGSHPLMIASAPRVRRVDRAGPPHRVTEMFNRYPQHRYGFSAGPTVPLLPLVTFRRAPPGPAIAEMPPGGRRGPTSAGDDKEDPHFCWG